ncbi:MAG TPA: hypothetical protein VMR86_11475 [Myxococcota bacterium]|nr:hypothetical protein [Myxococcota bacterium]
MIRKLAAAALCLALAACASTIQRGAAMHAQELLNDASYAEALSATQEFIYDDEGTPDALEELYLLRGQALEGLGRKSEAIELYHLLVRSHSGRAAAYQARGRLVDLGEPCAP